ncbi:MAG: NAD+ synthase [Betaproteobacteria bacterium]|nr:NAD+ synthase [Betaproteobacteria bacterium]
MTLKILVAQLNATVGDLVGNAERIRQSAHRAYAQGAQVVLTPELSLVGYPPEDLLLRPLFLKRAAQVLDELVVQTSQWPGLAVVVGHPRLLEGRLVNSATVARDGAVLACYGKLELPNYAVFDEQRYFVADGAPVVFESAGKRLGIAICEDVWFGRAAAMSKAEGAEALLVLNASPFHLNKQEERLAVVRKHVSRHRIPTLFCNLVGGQDELVFDGDSFVLDAAGEVCARARRFVEDDITVNFSASGALVPGAVAEELSADAQAYEALVLGTRDYVLKNGFKGGIVGLSGGIDSALTLAIAVDALGADQVTAVMMPSPFTAEISLEDAKACAQALGVKLSTVAIEPMMQAFTKSLEPTFGGPGQGLTQENLQSRIRGVLLMALSNETGRLVLTTGNKSEMAMGYCTLYGDMVGGYAVIKDLLKGGVYRLARLCNERAQAAGRPQPIPERTISRAPSAELRPDQTDQDSLPPYDELDDILARFVERGESIDDVLAAGHDRATVAKVLRLLRLSEYKRRQAAPGARISPRAFGRDWRFPITNRFETEKEMPQAS